MKKIWLFFLLFITACSPQATATSAPETSEVSETSDVLTATPPSNETAVTTEAVTDSPTNTLAVDTTASISATLVGTKASYVINFTSPNKLSCNTYDVVNHPGFFTTDPSSCLPNVPANNQQWAAAIQNFPLKVGTPVPFLNFLTPAAGVANEAGFGIKPNPDYQGLQYFTLDLGQNKILVWINATAAQDVITGPSGGSGNEDGGSGEGGGGEVPCDPVLGCGYE